MDAKPADGTKILQKFKVRLIEVLCKDPDFLLQYCQSSGVLTQREYDHVKACALPWDKARDILDFTMKKDPSRVQTFLNILKKKEVQDEFPNLEFLNQLPPSKSIATGKKRKKSREKEPEEEVPRNQPCKVKKTSRTVTEKQLMMVARNISPTNWKEVGRVALEIPSIRLEEIVEENPRSHREQVFNMLRLWSMRERDNATPSHLHKLLTEEQIMGIDFLLEDS